VEEKKSFEKRLEESTSIKEGDVREAELEWKFENNIPDILFGRSSSVRCLSGGVSKTVLCA